MRTTLRNPKQYSHTSVSCGKENAYQSRLESQSNGVTRNMGSLSIKVILIPVSSYKSVCYMSASGQLDSRVTPLLWLSSLD